MAMPSGSAAVAPGLQVSASRGLLCITEKCYIHTIDY